MNKQLINLIIKVSVYIVFSLFLGSIVHETIHVIQFHQSDIALKEVCFAGYKGNFSGTGPAVGWVMSYEPLNLTENYYTSLVSYFKEPTETIPIISEIIVSLVVCLLLSINAAKEYIKLREIEE